MGLMTTPAATGQERTIASSALDPVDVAGGLRLSIARLARILRYQDEGNLSATLISILATINREGPITLGRLAAEEHLAPPSVTKAVDRLVAEGLVSRRPDSKDRRVVHVEVSAAGRRLIIASRRRRTAWLATRLAELSEDELELVARAAPVLERLTRLAPGEVER
jgi:DNA-binding MarR family transcriptional regulator